MSVPRRREQKAKCSASIAKILVLFIWQEAGVKGQINKNRSLSEFFVCGRKRWWYGGLRGGGGNVCVWCGGKRDGISCDSAKWTGLSDFTNWVGRSMVVHQHEKHV